MRIRRRPQPSSLQLGSDPTTSAAPPRNAARGRGWLGAGDGGEDREAGLHASADPGRKSGVARRLALPQDDNVVVADCGRRMGDGGGAQPQQQQQRGADDGGHRRLSAVSNGHRGADEKDGVARTGDVGGKSEPVAAKAEERATSNGALQLALVPVEGKASSNGGGGGGAGAKKRRGPAVLLEGSRCSRVNGRGWRCSQPTLVGYSLCEHHLGKGRMRSAAAAAAARGKLGRTEHGASTPAAAGAGTVAAAPPPKAEGPPSLPQPQC